ISVVLLLLVSRIGLVSSYRLGALVALLVRCIAYWVSPRCVEQIWEDSLIQDPGRSV
ncbi:hypothetical protein U1Q18_039286, partial [Sarracenia purpurea var. burkii]